MGDVTRHLSRSEWACQCGCGLQDPHPALHMGWQQLVDLVQLEVAKTAHLTISGPCRCIKHNASIPGSSPNSRHTPDTRNGYCRAGDGYVWTWNHDGTKKIRFPLERLRELAQTVPQFASGGIGAYCDAIGPRLHLDVDRPYPARWARLNGHDASLADVLEAAALWEKTNGETWA